MKNSLYLVAFLGTRKLLPASAVDGAAIAFGLESLLPLNIPPSNPIMYCIHHDELQQKSIRLNGEIYSCHDGKIMINCSDEICKDNNLLFNTTSGILYSNFSLFCNETFDEIIQCYNGQLPNDTVAFIPTIQPRTIRRNRSGLLNYLLEFFGILEKSTEVPHDEKSKWIPQPLEIPPEPATTPEPHIYLVKSNDNNGKVTWHFYRSLSDLYLRSEKLKVPMSSFERNNVRSFTISEYNAMKANGEVVDF